jgi:CheY-like chemotaxis protein
MSGRSGADLHDLKNPLAAVVTNLDLAARDIAEAIARYGGSALLVALREEIEDAQRGADRLRDLVTDVAEGSSEQLVVAASDTEVAGRRHRILVIDDEPMMGRLVHRTLGVEHDVAIAHHATDALERISAGERFDLIFCDVMMPEMDGVELHAALTQQAPDQAAAMVFLTGGGFTPMMRARLDRLGSARIEKPFDIPALRAFVNARFTAAH